MSIRSWYDDESGAIGPAYAVAILVLVAIAGVGFDYGRMAGLDTELQDAADHAALAGATQLDGKSGACARAFDAAKNFIRNNTRIANDGGGAAVTFVSTTASTADCSSVVAANGSFIRFWQDRDKTTPAIPDDDATARFIEVSVDTRTVRYALTPLVGLFNSGAQHAGALAGLGSSICRVPPVFMCNPTEPYNGGSGDSNALFDGDAERGAGLILLPGNPVTPGNFGFLNVSGLGNPTAAGTVAKAIGWDELPIDCTAVDSTTGLTPGQKAVVFSAFNTRFDIVDNGANTCPSGGNCSASTLTRQDLVLKGNGGGKCGLASGNGNGWKESGKAYHPFANAPLTAAQTANVDTMGYPRDICHAWGGSAACPGGIVGDKAWDRDAFFKVNYNWTHSDWVTNTGLSDQATRFEVYEWEKANPPGNRPKAVAGGTSYAQPSGLCAPGAGADDPDRRRMTIAVVNCLSEPNVNGAGEVRISRYVDVFLTEPSANRTNPNNSAGNTSSDQVYVEIIGNSRLAGGGEDAQTIRRDVPYLVR